MAKDILTEVQQAVRASEKMLGLKRGSSATVRRARSGVRSFTVPGRPVPKPRMTKSDKWAKDRPQVNRYRAYATEIVMRSPLDVALPVLVQSGVTLTVHFYFPIPASWSAVQRDAARGQRMLCMPDIKNLIAGVEDALWPKGEADDSAVWCYQDCWKVYDDGEGPRTEISFRFEKEKNHE